MKQSSIWVTPQALKTSKMLIDDLHINDGVGLASILNVSPAFSNFEAVSLWVQGKLTSDYERFSSYEALRSSLIGSVPDFLQGDSW